MAVGIRPLRTYLTILVVDVEHIRMRIGPALLGCVIVTGDALRFWHALGVTVEAAAYHDLLELVSYLDTPKDQVKPPLAMNVGPHDTKLATLAVDLELVCVIV